MLLFDRSRASGGRCRICRTIPVQGPISILGRVGTTRALRPEERTWFTDLETRRGRNVRGVALGHEELLSPGRMEGIWVRALRPRIGSADRDRSGADSFPKRQSFPKSFVSVFGCGAIQEF